MNEKHLNWISEAVYVYGFISREHLVRRFGMTQVQASRALQAFKKLRPGVLDYDPTERCYKCTYTPKKLPSPYLSGEARKKALARKRKKHPKNKGLSSLAVVN